MPESTKLVDFILSMMSWVPTYVLAPIQIDHVERLSSPLYVASALWFRHVLLHK